MRSKRYSTFCSGEKRKGLHYSHRETSSPFNESGATFQRCLITDTSDYLRRIERLKDLELHLLFGIMRTYRPSIEERVVNEIKPLFGT